MAVSLSVVLAWEIHLFVVTSHGNHSRIGFIVIPRNMMTFFFKKVTFVPTITGGVREPNLI